MSFNNPISDTAAQVDFCNCSDHDKAENYEKFGEFLVESESARGKYRDSGVDNLIEFGRPSLEDYNFNGPGHQEFDAFILSFEQARRRYQWSDASSILFLQGHLRDYALKYFIGFMRTLVDEIPRTWVYIRKEFAAKFHPDSPVMKFLNAVQQQNEPLMDFITRKFKLCQDNNLVLYDCEFVHGVIEGLLPEFSGAFRQFCPNFTDSEFGSTVLYFLDNRHIAEQKLLMEVPSLPISPHGESRDQPQAVSKGQNGKNSKIIVFVPFVNCMQAGVTSDEENSTSVEETNSYPKSKAFFSMTKDQGHVADVTSAHILEAKASKSTPNTISTSVIINTCNVTTSGKSVRPHSIHLKASFILCGKFNSNSVACEESKVFPWQRPFVYHRFQLKIKESMILFSKVPHNAKFWNLKFRPQPYLYHLSDNALPPVNRFLLGTNSVSSNAPLVDPQISNFGQSIIRVQFFSSKNSRKINRAKRNVLSAKLLPAFKLNPTLFEGNSPKRKTKSRECHLVRKCKFKRQKRKLLV
nr:PREDICTED: uncharacterized protein LOC109033688 [Bemisia tabaci]